MVQYTYVFYLPVDRIENQIKLNQIEYSWLTTEKMNHKIKWSVLLLGFIIL